MSLPIVVQQSDPHQREFLEGVVRRAWPGKTYELSTFEDLVDLTKNQRCRLIFVELKPGGNDQLEWIRRHQEDNVIGIITWKWDEEQLRPFLDAGLSDYIIKPYQPEKIERMVSNRKQFMESESAG